MDAQANVSLCLERNLEAGRGQRIACMAGDRELTFEQLWGEVNRMGGLLRELGVRREERVLLVLDNTTVFPIAFLGALRIGAVPVPVSTLDTPENFRHFIEDSYVRVVVCDGERLSTLQASLAGHDLLYLTRAKDTGAFGGEDAGDTVSPASVIELDGALQAQERELSPVSTHPDDMAFWLYSSGSTGKPKGVVHVHGSVRVTCENFARQVLGVHEDDRMFATTKLHYAYGLGNGLFFPLYFGASAILLEGPAALEHILRTLRERRPTIFCSIPSLYALLAGDPDADGAFDSVRMCLSAGEPLPLQTFESCRERFGVTLLDGIGSTEMLTTYCTNRPGGVVAGTTGRPVPGYELRLVDEQGSVVHGPGVGALEVRGDSCAAYYWHQRERTRRCMRGEWFASGDRFERRGDGTYVYVGRTDDMLKIGGLWISPIDMEQVLLEHPAVRGAGVVGVELRGHTRMAAFVECDEQAVADEHLANSLRDWCKQRMRDYEYPHIVRFIDELPRTITGKPQRYKLRELAERAPAREGPTPQEDPAVARLSGDRARDAEQPDVGASSGSAVDERGWLSRELQGAERARSEATVLELIKTHIAEMLGEQSPEQIDPQCGFDDLGFDSLAAMELRNRLSRATGLTLPSTLAFECPTPAAVAALIRSMLDTPGGDNAVAAGEPPRQSDRASASIHGRPAGAEGSAAAWKGGEQDEIDRTAIDAMDAADLVRHALERSLDESPAGTRPAPDRSGRADSRQESTRTRR